MRQEFQTLATVLSSKLDPNELSEPNPDLLKMAEPVIQAIKRYFRAEVIGLENMPKGKALIVGNHNAGITFMEPFILGLEWHLATKGEEIIHPLGHDIMVTLPLVGNMLKSLGVIRASHESADMAFDAGRKVMVFPGGNYEAFRPYHQRYQVDFGGKIGYIRLALRNKVPIVPVVSIGGHETFFVLRRGERLARMTGTRKYLRSESFPVFVGLPWGIGMGPIFHLPLPSKSTIIVGKPISLGRYYRTKASNKEVMQKLSLMVQAELQRIMDEYAPKRRWPIFG